MNRFQFMRFLAKGNRLSFDVPVEEQRIYLESLGLPTTDIERSYKQYLCQKFFIATWKIPVYNILAGIALPFFVFLNILKGLFAQQGMCVDAIGEFKGLEEVIPNELSEKYNINNDLWFEGGALRFSDLLFIFRLIIRYPISPYFITKCVFKICRYSYMFTKYTPKALMVHNEYSFTSSVLTSYCDYRNVEHINMLHGEKLYFIRDSFFRYHRCYVWSEYYKQLFISLKAEPSQFRIALPPSMQIDCGRYFDQRYYADYKYYLAKFNEAQIESIVMSMKFADKQGKTVKYRPHPRYSDITLLEKYVNKDSIEDPKEVNILASIASLSYAVGSYTTVLNQAFHANKSIVLDDVTFRDLYMKLKDRQYILDDCNRIYLSQFQKK